MIFFSYDSGSSEPTYPNTGSDFTIEARLGENVNLQCTSSLGEPAFAEWRKEYSQLPASARKIGVENHFLNLFLPFFIIII